MKVSARILLMAVALLYGSATYAQMIEDPTSWTYEVKKKSAGAYELIFHLDLKEPWHIYALKPGGDGYEIAPSFDFDKNTAVKLKGTVTEKGNRKEAHLEGIDGKVAFYAGKVDYKQEVTVTGKTTITGKHGYQVCNNSICLPPKDKTFVFEIPGK